MDDTRARITVTVADSGAESVHNQLNEIAWDVFERGGSGAHRIRAWIRDVGEPLARHRARQSGGKGEAATSWTVAELNG